MDRHRLPHLPRRAHRAQRVVLVRNGDAKDRHHRVADELLDRAAVPLEDRAEVCEVAAHARAKRLGVGGLAERGRSDEVAEEHGDDLARLALRRGDGQLGAARAAEPCVVRIVATTARARRHARSLGRRTGMDSSPLTDSNRRPPPYHRATRRERRARPGSRGHGSPARRRNRPKTSDLPWTPVPALVFPQGSLGYAGAGSPGRAISSVSAMVSLRPASVARMTSSAASEARARSMSSRPTGLSP